MASAVPSFQEENLMASDEQVESKPMSRSAEIRGLIESMEQKILGGESKATIGDYVRLIQLEREMAAEEPKEVRLRWIGEKDTSNEP